MARLKAIERGITPTQEIICSYLARGATTRAAAEASGQSERSVAKIRVLPHVRERIQEIQLDMYVEFLSGTMAQSKKALKILIGLLEDKDPKVRLQALSLWIKIVSVFPSSYALTQLSDEELKSLASKA